MPTPKKKQTPPTSKKAPEVQPPAPDAKPIDIEGQVGALIDPAGLDNRQLTQEEYEALCRCLDSLRCEGGKGFAGPASPARLIWSFFDKREIDDTAEDVVERLIRTYLGDSAFREISNGALDGDLRRTNGILCGTWGVGQALSREMHRVFETVSSPEIRTLQDTLATLRTETWFADWLKTQVATIGNAKLPGDKCPSPLQVMGSLTRAAGEWDESLKAANKTLAQRPDLFEKPKGKAA